MIYVIARSDNAAELFLKRNPSASDIIIKLNQRSFFSFLNDVIMNANSDYACIIHDDVTLCSDFNDKLTLLISELNQSWPSWGLAGNSGVAPFRVGYSSTQIVRYLSDPHGGPNFIGHILPAMSIDGNVMLLNVRSLRERKVRVPSFDGFQLYDIILSIETISSGLGVFIAPHLSCWHDSKGKSEHFNQAADTDTFREYLASRIKNRHLLTINGLITSRLNSNILADRIDIELESLTSACLYRQKRTVAIVTRTQFNRPELLDRCLKSISAFIVSNSSGVEFRSYIVTDRNPPTTLDFNSDIIICETSINDTRYKLVQCAVRNIEADFFWFIDDDDWIFPNESRRLSMVINLAPKNSVFYFDSAHYNEMPFPEAGLGLVESYRSTQQRYFPGRKFSCSLSGNNYTPFCGVIFSRDSLLNIPDHVYDTITYFEDFMTILNTLLIGNIPIVIDKLYVGISIREKGNTVTETDRTKWNKSMSELVSHLVNDKRYFQLTSLPIECICEQDNKQSEIAQLRTQLYMISHSRSWRITRPLRVISRLLRGHIKIRDIISRINSN